MSQFSKLYTAGATESVAMIADTLTYLQVGYDCVISQETYQNQLGDGGFAPVRTLTASVLLDGAPEFRMGGRVDVGGKQYRIVGIDTDNATVDLTLQSPDQR